MANRQGTDGRQGMDRKAKEWNARVEGHEDTLIKYHGAVSIGHANFAVGRASINDLCGCHVAWVKRGLRVEPHSGTHPHDEGPSYQCFGEVVHAVSPIVSAIAWSTRAIPTTIIFLWRRWLLSRGIPCRRVIILASILVPDISRKVPMSR